MKMEQKQELIPSVWNRTSLSHGKVMIQNDNHKHADSVLLYNKNKLSPLELKDMLRKSPASYLFEMMKFNLLCEKCNSARCSLNYINDHYQRICPKCLRFEKRKNKTIKPLSESYKQRKVKDF
jgi:hypothetical protein